MKYIVICEFTNENDDDESYIPYIFPKFINHDKFAMTIVAHRKAQGSYFGYIEGAGFVNVDDINNQLQCFGRSETLNTNSAPSDSEIVNQRYVVNDYQNIRDMITEQEVFDFYGVNKND